MRLIIINACLLACLVLGLPSCKKDLSFEKEPEAGHEITLGKYLAKTDRCHTDHRMQILYGARPGYRSEMIEGRLISMRNLEQKTSRDLVDQPLLTIPVHVIVVHRPGDPLGSPRNISEQRIQSQIAALNRDFLRKNPDAIKTPSVFPVGSGQIQFCLASLDPGGKPTNGISRYATNQNFDNYELSIKRNTRWDPGRYLNIWIVSDIDALGYAYLPTPTSLPHPDEDGVVILTEVFGGPNSGALAPFNLGRTVTHEVGHYLGLDHIWGDGCQIDDGITDTPSQREENYDCPTHPSPSCNNQGDMFMNYMDYTNDDCMNAFTTGQIAYMRTILATSRASLILPGRTDCPSDMNGGGNPESTCNDGIRNGDETGIDCGGSCPDCQTGPDAGVTNVNYTVENSGCNQSIRLKITLTNFGSVKLTSAVVEVSAGGQKLIQYPWSGSLIPSASTTVALTPMSLASGSYQIRVVSKNPNGKADGNPVNDAFSTSLSVKGSNQLTLVIKPDDYGGDISWKIQDNTGRVVASGGTYPDFNRTLIKETICLPAGCYRLIMIDSYGDGLCCDYGEGWYELQDASGSVLLESDGYYGYSETQWFCQDDSGGLSRLDVQREPRLARLKQRISTGTFQDSKN